MYFYSLGNSNTSLSSADFVFKIIFLKNSIRGTIRVTNGLHPDQNRCSVGTDLSLNCLQTNVQINGEKIKKK